MIMIGRMAGVVLGGGMDLALGGTVVPVVGVAEAEVDTIVTAMELEDTEDLVIGLEVEEDLVIGLEVEEDQGVEAVGLVLVAVGLVVIKKDLEMLHAACPPLAFAMAYTPYKLLHNPLV